MILRISVTAKGFQHAGTQQIMNTFPNYCNLQSHIGTTPYSMVSMDSRAIGVHALSL